MGGLYVTVEEQLNDHGLAELALAPADATVGLRDLEERKKEVSKEWTEKVNSQRTRVDDITRSIHDRKVVRQVEVREVMFPEEGIVRKQRIDNGEFVGLARPMTDGERQIPIPYPEEAKDGIALDWPDGAPFDRGHVVVYREQMDPGKAAELYQVVRMTRDEEKAGTEHEWRVTLLPYGEENGEPLDGLASALRLAGHEEFAAAGVEWLISNTPGVPAPVEGDEEAASTDDHDFTEGEDKDLEDDEEEDDDDDE